MDFPDLFADSNRFHFYFVFPPDAGKEYLLPTLATLDMDFPVNEHTMKIHRAVAPAWSKAYSAFKSGNYSDMEECLSSAYSRGCLTPGLSLAHGVALLMVSNLSLAKEVLEKGLGLARRRGDTLLETAFCINLGQLYHDIAMPSLAKEVLDTACSLCRADGNFELLLVALRQQALLDLFQGNPAACEFHVDSAMEIADSRGLDGERTSLHYVLGLLSTATGNLQSAEKHLSRSIETGSRGRCAQLPRIWFQVALVKLLLGHVESAQNAVDKSLKAAKQESNILSHARGVSMALTIEVAAGQKTPDVGLFDQAMEMEQRSGYRFGILRHRLILAKLCLQHQNVEGALGLCRTAASLADEIGHEVSK